MTRTGQDCRRHDPLDAPRIKGTRTRYLPLVRRPRPSTFPLLRRPVLVLGAVLLCVMLRSAHATAPSQIPGDYILLSASVGARCSSTFSYSNAPVVNVGNPLLLLPHSTASTANGTCTSSSNADPKIASFALITTDAYMTRLQAPPNTKDPLIEAVLRTNALLGIGISPLVCGQFTVRQGAFVAFVNNPNQQFLQDFSGLKEGKTLMLVAEANVLQPQRCIYMSTAARYASSAQDRAGGGGRNCFPASALFHLDMHGHAISTASGGIEGTMRAAELVRGTKLATGAILAFTHRQPNGWHQYLRISTESGVELVLSPGHYVLMHNRQLRAAHAVCPGDELAAAPGASQKGNAHRVVAVSNVRLQGRYNPHTASGVLYVNGFVVSCYTTAVHPWLSHSGIQVLNMLHRWAPRRISEVISTWLDNDPLPSWAMRLMPGGPEHW